MQEEEMIYGLSYVKWPGTPSRMQNNTSRPFDKDAETARAEAWKREAERLGYVESRARRVMVVEVGLDRWGSDNPPTPTDVTLSNGIKTWHMGADAFTVRIEEREG
jgi:hypothetical protein